MDIEVEIKKLAKEFKKEIQEDASSSANEAEFKTKVTIHIEEFASKINLNLHRREEYTLINGRADAVYNRLIIEYEPPGSLKGNNSLRTNQHAINQLKTYVEGLVSRERHKPERLAGVVLDGNYFIFVRNKQDVWYIDQPLKVDDYSTEYFLKLLTSLSTELALIPENLVKDFGENTAVSRKAVSTLFNILTTTTNPKINTLFDQWSLQFGEVCDYEEASKLDVESFARRFGISVYNIKPFKFFFCLHTYYATFIKLLAVQIVHYYLMPGLGTDLKQATTFGVDDLKNYLRRIENGGIFKELGIGNFIEGDFFGWYLDVWDESIYESLKSMISQLANYSLVTLDVDPDTTRDLLKKLYQQLMPKELRHNLGEYYTPDWLAERLLNMLESGKFQGDPNKRLLDPACGSGTFLVIAIKKIREYAWKNVLPESLVLEKILSNVVGFDLNPLAVISARTNYLLALGDLLQHRRGEINIPVYLCDSIMTPREGDDLFESGVVKFNTTVGPFSIPSSLVKSQYIDLLADFLEESVKLDLNQEQFINKLCNKIPLIKERDEREIKVVYELYEKLQSLEQNGINGIWARIVKNAFAPLFVGEFDYVAGNPPWINWESLPENYRKDTFYLWQKYNLFKYKGFEAILGKAKDDISVLMTYVSLDIYLKDRGKLGFLITQSVFKTSGAGQGFRRFKLENTGTPIQVLHVDDMVELKPFEGASNRTSAMILQKGKPTKYPLKSYLFWRKKVKGESIPMEMNLNEALEITERKQYIAEPINQNDVTSSWITGRPKAVKAIRKILGQSDYDAHEGTNTGGANAVYWIEILNVRNDRMIVISNIVEGQRTKVEDIQTAIEPDLIYPLVRGRDVKRWSAVPSCQIILTHLPTMKLKAIPEIEMKEYYPKSYLYFKRFERILRQRSAFKRYFTKEKKSGENVETGPFYSMFNIGKYTFAPYKVVWRRVAQKLDATVIGKLNDKCIIPDATLNLISCTDFQEANYICSLLNSIPYRFGVTSYIVLHPDTHILENLRLPLFKPDNEIHVRLSQLSKMNHEAAKINDDLTINENEKEINKLAAQLWSLSEAELDDIELSLSELS